MLAQLKLRHIPPAVRGACEALPKAEIFVIAGLVAAAMVDGRLLPGAALAGLAFALLRLLARGRLFQRTPADVGIGLLLLMLPVTLWASASSDLTRPQVWRVLGGAAFYYALANWITHRRRLNWSLGVGALAGVGLAGFALISVEGWDVGKFSFIPTEIYARMTVLVSDTANPNVIAGSVLLLAVLSLALVLFTQGAPWAPARLGLGALLLAMLAVIVLTQARGAWLAFAVAAALLAVLRWRWGWLLLLLALLAAGVTVGNIGLARVVDLISTSGSVEGVDGRVEIWSRAIYMIQDFPFTGVGMGSYKRVADLLYPFFLFPPDSIWHAHNLFLQIAVDLGIPGLIAWLSIYASVCVVSWRVYWFGRRRDDLWVAGVGAGFLAVQLALALHGIVDAVTWGMVRPAPLVWALWGMAMAAGNLYLRPQSMVLRPRPDEAAQISGQTLG